jgi:hypothetical protein
MGTPKGIPCRIVDLASGDRIFVYQTAPDTVVQIRREIETEVSLTDISYKVGATLTRQELRQFITLLQKCL